MRTADFHYDLPETSIAQEPAEPRHSARLLDTATMHDHRFVDLPQLLDPGDLVVVNRTRVRAARLRGRKVATGGAVEALLLEPLGGGRWEALVRPARRLRSGVRLDFGELSAEVMASPSNGVALIRFDLPDAQVEAVVARVGEVPLPPYFTGSLADAERYQTMFAASVGSAAAPTAGLHFTPAVRAGLEERGVAIAEVDLHVGLATFRPIGTERVEDHRIHTERFEVPAATARAVAEARRRGGSVVAVGTTVVRALESAADDGDVRAVAGSTDLYITPGYRFRAVDALVTNFHLPGSTLLVLVEAFMGPGWRGVYAAALERGYRFLSFGDAMLARRTG